MSDHHCPCIDLGVTFDDETPHENAEVCKNALANTIHGMKNFTAEGAVLTILSEIDIATGVRPDVLKMVGEQRVSHHLRVARCEAVRLLRLLRGPR